MALSNAIDNKNGNTIQPKIIPARAENCPAPTECQYFGGDNQCSLEECPFRSPREMNGGTIDGKSDQINRPSRKCFICGGAFNGFIGAVPICGSCKSKLTSVIARPYCPGCGRTVSKPHTLCSSCINSYTKD